MCDVYVNSVPAHCFLCQVSNHLCFTFRRSSIGTFIRSHPSSESSASSQSNKPKKEAPPKLDYRSMVSIDDMPALFVSFDSKFSSTFKFSRIASSFSSQFAVFVEKNVLGKVFFWIVVDSAITAPSHASQRNAFVGFPNGRKAKKDEKQMKKFSSFG